MSENKVYIIGHKSPDLDSVAAAIAYADFKNKVEKTDKYVPAVAGEINQETKYTLDKFGFEKPEVLEDASGKEIVLVDHNEFSQAADGVEEAFISEVLDHHKVNFKYDNPIVFCVCPWGATCSIVARKYFNKNLEISEKLAGLMLSAILVDTVITKSPTCTNYDKKIIEDLSDLAGIQNWQEFGMELFQVRSSVKDLKASEIIKGDFKDFNFKNGKVGIGQVETVNLDEFKEKESELFSALDDLRREGEYHTVVLFITDIIKEGSKFLVSSEDNLMVEQSLNSKLENNKAYLDGVISRKKQVAPKFAEVFDK